MAQQEKIRACYQHACLRHESGERMTNSSLRERFNIGDKNYSVASRIIRETVKAGFIKPFDPDNQAIRYTSYVPFWVML
jgi:predicted HTH transcriptional regulator